jgi:hypothetical protein
MTTLTVKEQVAILANELCQCGHWKKRGHAVCQGCFHRLSFVARNALYAKIPSFGESYKRALDELKIGEQWRNTRYVDPRRRRTAGGA